MTCMNKDDTYTNNIINEKRQINRSNNAIDINYLEKQINNLQEIDESQKQIIYNIINESKQKQNYETTHDNINVSVSMTHIEQIVDNMLVNDNINIKHLPDFVERQLYLNIIKIVLNIIAETTKTSKIEFLGHEISLHPWKFKMNALALKIN